MHSAPVRQRPPTLGLFVLSAAIFLGGLEISTSLCAAPAAAEAQSGLRRNWLPALFAPAQRDERQVALSHLETAGLSLEGDSFLESIRSGHRSSRAERRWQGGGRRAVEGPGAITVGAPKPARCKIRTRTTGDHCRDSRARCGSGAGIRYGGFVEFCDRVSAQRPTVDRELRGGGNAPRNRARDCAGWLPAGADF